MVSPKREMKRGEGKLPLQDGIGRHVKENQNQSSPRNRQQKTLQASPPQPSPGAGDGLQFINLLGTEKHDAEGKNTVRSHARRHAWKNQRQRQEKKEVSSTKVSIRSQNHIKPKEKVDYIPEPSSHGDQSYYSQCSKFREVAQLLPQRPSPGPPSRVSLSHQGAFLNLPPELARCAETALAMIAQPSLTQIEFENGRSDPFGVFPIPLTPRLHHLIHYSRDIRNLIHEDTQDALSFHMGSCPALVYATLAFKTSFSSSNQGLKDAEREYFLQKSIIAINAELSSLNQLGLSDGTIAAVACLTNMENLNGDKVKARIHMNGLRQMVTMRGGMNTLGMNGVLRRLVLWADVFSATRWQSTPQFALAELPELLNLPPLGSFRPHATPRPYFSIKNPSLLEAAAMTSNADLPVLMNSIYELAHFLDNAPLKDPGLLDRASFPDRIYIIEHKILLLISQNEGMQPRDSMILPLLHSLLLYIYTNIRLTPLDGQIRRTLVSRLQTCLQGADLDALNINFPHELRWSLFLGGGAASYGSPEREFFLQTLVASRCRREWGSWEHIVLGLKGMETSFLARCKEFWGEVDVKREKVDWHHQAVHRPECLGEEDYFVKREVKDG